MWGHLNHRAPYMEALLSGSSCPKPIEQPQVHSVSASLEINLFPCFTWIFESIPSRIPSDCLKRKFQVIPRLKERRANFLLPPIKKIKQQPTKKPPKRKQNPQTMPPPTNNQKTNPKLPNLKPNKAATGRELLLSRSMILSEWEKTTNWIIEKK